tara:strand:+ start:2601 stop:2906 length:306 start_codon:yes stop_codon:yes gene_type:complete
MRKRNWIEFDNEKNQISTNGALPSINKPDIIKVFTQKKGKGKIVTIVSGIKFKEVTHSREFLKKLKIFCGTGGKLNSCFIQLQGDMVEKVNSFLRKEGYQN